MILIADSGSTKTIWYLTNGQEYTIYHTKGYNPFLLSTAEIEGSLKKDLFPQLNISVDQVQQIHFYGAGCGSVETQECVRNLLKKCFSNALVNVHNDLLGTARATCQNNAGLCCILGTGSNACVFDGNQIIDNTVSLGYILGDEGSGANIGKLLIQSFFYKKLPAELTKAFEQKYKLSRGPFLTRLFKGNMPNQYLASFSLFCAEKIEHLFIQELVGQAFDSFIQEHVLPFLKKYPDLVVHFSGSVAYGYQEILRKRLTPYNIRLGKIIKAPFPDLLDYHTTLAGQLK
ncbi:MAG: hypothetical protein GY810_15225 [Aureispira sp.]|nr:hypothetical protein [Aureispira sp.]